ncbi:hypothetical protein [Aureimonas sp. AU40]|uniref:hypothetical protein n=1 Tax=Aureimonas sp. AU40 TaxID=1637747 RepID=UPI0012E3486C|nr:hypothetical protein [Aureimonas sp. AU40]
MRTDEAGAAFLRSLVAGADASRLAACVKPGPDGQPVGIEAAERILSGREMAHEWMLRQLDGKMSAAAQRAYVPVVQASRTAVQEAAVEVKRSAGPRVPENHPVYSDPEVVALLEALPGAYVSAVRERRQVVMEAVEAAGG